MGWRTKSKRPPFVPKVDPPIPAEITEIVPTKTYMDGIVQRRSAEQVIAKDSNGRTYCFVTGSLQTVRPEIKKVGQKGFIRSIHTPNMYIHYFTDKETG